MSDAATSTVELRERAIDQSGWAHPVRFFQPHNPACYLYWILVAKGLVLYWGMITANSVYPTALTVGVASQVIYCLPWIWFLTRRDRYEREPAKLGVLAFLWGGLVATWLMSLPGNDAVLSLYAKLFGLKFHDNWGPAFTAPIVEESAKYVGVIMLVLLARNHVRNAYDGFLLGAFVGLGFQVFENVLYVANAAKGNFGSQELADAVRIICVRTVAGFWSHTLFSAVAGTGIGYFLGATNRSFAWRLGVAALFLLVACVAHGCWDAVLGSVLMAPLGALIGTVAIIIAWRFSDRRAREFVGAILEDDQAGGNITEREMTVLSGTPKQRRKYLKEIRETSGREGARQAGYVLDAATDLATAIAATDDVHSPEAEAARTELSRIRGVSAA